jgi:hypothetical protein
VATYRSVDELAELAKGVIAEPDAARQRAAVGRQIVLDAHTMDHRAEQLDTLLARHGLDGG